MVLLIMAVKWYFSVTVPKIAEIFGNSQKYFPLFWEISQIFGQFPRYLGNIPNGFCAGLGDYRASERSVIAYPMWVHMCRTDVTEGTHGRTCTALVYNGVSIGLWHTILLNLKNHVKTGGLAGRVRAARSDKNIETIETRVILIWNMQHSQDNGSDTSVGFEVSKATVIKTTPTTPRARAW